jgi:hypothetical protein
MSRITRNVGMVAMIGPSLSRDRTLTTMSYNEPPEWVGRGARDRAGWPNETFNPGVPRSHRAAGQRVEADTGEFRPSREPASPDMPTEEMPQPQPPYVPGGVVLPPPAPRPVIKPSFRLDRELEPLERTYLWLGICVRVLAIIALVCTIYALAICLSGHGVPLLVPGS